MMTMVAEPKTQVHKRPPPGSETGGGLLGAKRIELPGISEQQAIRNHPEVRAAATEALACLMELVLDDLSQGQADKDEAKR
jgi:hypothetical protein